MCDEENKKNVVPLGEHIDKLFNKEKVGQKFDGGKLQMARFYKQFPNAIKAIMEAGTYGMKKYSEGNGNTNWKQVPNAIQRYEDATLRHLDKYLTGEWLDSESNLPHLTHLIWCVGALIELHNDVTLDIEGKIEDINLLKKS